MGVKPSQKQVFNAALGLSWRFFVYLAAGIALIALLDWLL